MKNVPKLTWFLSVLALFLAGNLVFTACVKDVESSIQSLNQTDGISAYITKPDGSREYLKLKKFSEKDINPKLLEAMRVRSITQQKEEGKSVEERSCCSLSTVSITRINGTYTPNDNMWTWFWVFDSSGNWVAFYGAPIPDQPGAANCGSLYFTFNNIQSGHYGHVGLSYGFDFCAIEDWSI
jgi:hypothetical protein